VAHTYNPSYSGGRDQEDQCSEPVWANSLRAPISKKKEHHKKGTGGVAQMVQRMLSKRETKFKFQCRKKKKNIYIYIYIYITSTKQ
jgi:hypothetical protein